VGPRAGTRVQVKGRLTGRLVAVPDTDGELAHHLGRLEEVLLQHQPYNDEDDPAPAGLGPDALEALRRILGAVLAAERTPAVQLLGAAGTFELIPLRVLDLDSGDLATDGQAIAALGQALLVDELVSEVLREFSAGPHDAPTDLVASFARAHGILDLAPDDDTRTLAAIVAAGTSPVVLTSDQEGAYQRLTGRALAMFHLNDPLARYLYRGHTP
jgi:hypothetical protein